MLYHEEGHGKICILPSKKLQFVRVLISLISYLCSFSGGYFDMLMYFLKVVILGDVE